LDIVINIMGARSGFFLILSCFSLDVCGSNRMLASRNKSPSRLRDSPLMIRNRQGFKSP